MSTFREAVEDRVVESLATGVDRADRLAGLLVNNIPGAPALRNAINGLLALLGNSPGDSTADDIAPRPFQGGQCEGVLYTFQYTRTSRSSTTGNCNESVATLTGSLRGPISFFDEPDPTSSTGLRRVNGYRSGFNGAEVDGSYTNNGSECEYTGFKFSGLVITSGQDDCGGPDRVLPDPSGGIPPESAPIEYTDRDGVTVNVDGDVSYGPSFTNNGLIVIPFIYATANVRLTGQIGLDGTIELTPEISINPGGEEPVLGDENDGENPTEEGEDGDIIIGVQVKTLDSTGRLTEIGSTIGPDITAPRAASVMFLLDDGEISGWSVDYDVKNTDCLIPAPDWLPCTAVSVTPAEGVTVAWRAVYGQRLIPEDDEQG